MTIIKVSKDGKAIVKKKADEVVLLPLAPELTVDDGHTVHFDALPSTRTRRCVNVFLLMLALMVLVAGIVGGVYLYKYMAHKHKTHVRVQYMDTLPTAVAQSDEAPKLTRWCGVEEDIEIQIEEQVEKIEVPKFDECKSSVIIHDFNKNISVIVDNDDQECFLMDLDRKAMTPPKSFADLIAKYSQGYYMPKVEVVRRDYRVVTPKLTDIRFAGNTIRGECLGYDTYRLEKKLDRPEMFEIHFKLVKTFGYSDLRTLMKDQIYRTF